MDERAQDERAQDEPIEQDTGTDRELPSPDPGAPRMELVGESGASSDADPGPPEMEYFEKRDSRIRNDN
ncbi:MAG TPA: hypothetical protein VHJ34_01215 [Actinomycetota bacterium]|nr:hypothetical protein [Actinomycetota bacterium]